MKTILVAVDFSDITDRLLEVARDYAVALSAEVILLHVAEPEPDFVGFEVGPVSVRESLAHDMRTEHKDLQSLKPKFEQAGLTVRALQIQGASGQGIVEEATTLGASLIVIGSHGHGALWKLFAGSTAEDVLKHSSVPVLIVPAALA